MAGSCISLDCLQPGTMLWVWAVKWMKGMSDTDSSNVYDNVYLSLMLIIGHATYLLHPLSQHSKLVQRHDYLISLKYNCSTAHWPYIYKTWVLFKKNNVLRLIGWKFVQWKSDIWQLTWDYALYHLVEPKFHQHRVVYKDAQMYCIYVSL